MATLGEVIGWIVLLLFVLLVAAVFPLMVYHGYNPKNRISRGISAFWNSGGIKTIRRLVGVGFKVVWWVFCFFFVVWLVYLCADWYFTDSGWYPREREVAVFFKANQWLDGEIKTCYSGKSTTQYDPEAELTAISCPLEGNESHVLRVKFWGPIRADREKVWKCKRFQTKVTCWLQ